MLVVHGKANAGDARVSAVRAFSYQSSRHAPAGHTVFAYRARDGLLDRRLRATAGGEHPSA